MENEKATERYLRNEIKAIGGEAYKFVSPGVSGVPDRIVCLPDGKAVLSRLSPKARRAHNDKTAAR